MRVGDRLVVADTFARRALVIDAVSEKVVRTLPSHYPGHLQQIGPDLVLLSEEHSNRIIFWDLETGSTRWFTGCPHEVFRDLNVLPEQVLARERETVAPRFFNIRSVCDDRVNDTALYSPNGFAVSDDTVYVADADNHRVVAFDLETAAIKGVLRGFNNPSKIVVVQSE